MSRVYDDVTPVKKVGRPIVRGEGLVLLKNGDIRVPAVYNRVQAARAGLREAQAEVRRQRREFEGVLGDIAEQIASGGILFD